MRAVTEFDMLSSGDRILIGLSGGKDSLFLLYALAALKRRVGVKFSLAALTVDPMFTPDFAADTLTEYAAKLSIPHSVIKVDIDTAIKTSGKNACLTCAYFRRAAINRFAKEHDFNKVAYAHHHDDAVETFFMGLLYSGQLNVFTPVTYLDRSDITVIRPLIYLREAEVKEALKITGFSPLTSPCPRDGNTARQRVKELIAALSVDNPNVYDHLAAAMRQNALGELWPPAKDRSAMRESYRQLMRR